MDILIFLFGVLLFNTIYVIGKSSRGINNLRATLSFNMYACFMGILFTFDSIFNTIERTTFQLFRPHGFFSNFLDMYFIQNRFHESFTISNKDFFSNFVITERYFELFSRFETPKGAESFSFEFLVDTTMGEFSNYILEITTLTPSLYQEYGFENFFIKLLPLLFLISLFVSYSLWKIEIESLRESQKSHAIAPALYIVSALSFFLIAYTNNLLVLFVAIELGNLSISGLIALRNKTAIASEGSLKYFIGNAIVSMIMLSAILILYLNLGSFDITLVAEMLVSNPNIVVLISLYVFILSILIKMVIFPLNWAHSDAYAASDMCYFLMTAPKIAFLCKTASLSIISTTYGLSLSVILWTILILNILFAPVLAMGSSKTRKFLIATMMSNNVFFLAIILVFPVRTLDFILYGLINYFIGITLFFYVMLHHNRTNLNLSSDLTLFESRAYTSTVAKIAFYISLLSMAGIPPFPGFYFKLGVIYSAALSLQETAFYLILGSLIPFAYYLRLILISAFEHPELTDNLPVRLLPTNTPRHFLKQNISHFAVIFCLLVTIFFSADQVLIASLCFL